MTGPGDVLLALIIIGLPVIALTLLLTRWFKLKERRLELEVTMAAERAAQYAASNTQLETRIRVLEQIVTDGGIETAAQIDALRTPRLATKENV